MNSLKSFSNWMRGKLKKQELILLIFWWKWYVATHHRHHSNKQSLSHLKATDDLWLKSLTYYIAYEEITASLPHQEVSLKRVVNPGKDQSSVKVEAPQIYVVTPEDQISIIRKHRYVNPRSPQSVEGA